MYCTNHQASGGSILTAPPPGSPQVPLGSGSLAPPPLPPPLLYIGMYGTNSLVSKGEQQHKT